MTARTPYQAGGGDVSATLSELERKLRELERELNATARSSDAASPTPPAPPAPATDDAPPPPPPAPPAPDADTLIAQARARLGTLDGQVDELLRFREQLQRTARELEEEYSRVLARIGAPLAAADPAPAPPPAPAPIRAPIAPAVAEAALLPGHPAFAHPEPTPAPPPPLAEHAPPPIAPPAPEPPATPHEDTAFDGAIVIDAGPFTDIAGLSAFEQGLARMPGAEDVYVSGFEGNRALVELRLAHPVALVREMRQVVPTPFTVTEAAAGRLRLDVTAIAPGS